MPKGKPSSSASRPQRQSLPPCPAASLPACPACPPACHKQVIEDFGLLSFHPLAIEDRQSVAALVALIDKSNGYVFAGLARPGERPQPSCLLLRLV